MSILINPLLSTIWRKDQEHLVRKQIGSSPIYPSLNCKTNPAISIKSTNSSLFTRSIKRMVIVKNNLLTGAVVPNQEEEYNPQADYKRFSVFSFAAHTPLEGAVDPH